MDGIEEQLEKLILYLRSYRAVMRDPKMLPPGVQSRDELESQIKDLFVALMGYSASLQEKEEEERGKIDERLKYLLNERIGDKTMEESSRLIKDEISHLRGVIKGLPKINPGEREIKANLKMLKGEIKNLSRKPAIVNLEESKTMKEIFRLRKDMANLWKEEEEEIYIVYPSAGGKKTVSAGTLVIDFLMGEATLHDGTTERTSHRLENTKFEKVESLSIDTNKDVTISLDSGGKYEIERNQRFAIKPQPFRIAYIECTEETKIKVFASTNKEEAINISRPTTMDVDDRRFTTVIEYNVDGNPIYVADAEAGSEKNEKKWRIKKLVYSSSNVTDIQWAGGSTSFNFAWDDRASYQYA